MNTALLIYLVMQLDSIREFLVFIVAASAIVSGVTSFFMLMIALDNEADSEMYIAISRWFKRFAPIALASMVMFALIPSTKTAIYMVGGSGLVEALQSEHAQEVGVKAYRLLMKKLDEELSDD